MSRVPVPLQPDTPATVAASLHIATLTPNTRRAYDAQWRQWAEHARQSDVSPLPADPIEVAHWLARRLGLARTTLDVDGRAGTCQRQSLARTPYPLRVSPPLRRQSQAERPGASVATLRSAIAAVRFAHLAHGLTFDSSHPDLLLALRAARQRDCRGAVQARPMKADTVRAILGSLGDTPRDCRDAVLLALGYGFARRRSELVGLDYLRPGDGTGILTLTPDTIELRLSQMKQGKPGGHVFVMPRSPNEAVGNAIERWVELAGIQPGAPLLRRVHRSGRIGEARLDAQSVALIVKARMRALLENEGVAPASARQEANGYRGHSLRVGFAVSAAEAGASVLAVQKALGHASPAMAARYAEAAEAARMSPHNLEGVALGGSFKRRRKARAQHHKPR